MDEVDVCTITPLGDGSFLLTLGSSKVQQMGQRIAGEMVASGVTLDDLSAALDDERDGDYREHYAGR